MFETSVWEDGGVDSLIVTVSDLYYCQLNKWLRSIPTIFGRDGVGKRQEVSFPHKTGDHMATAGRDQEP